jgi:polysaccharide biosynthesis protein PslJ
LSWFGGLAALHGEWWSRRRPRDPVDVLTIFLIPCLAIPSNFIVGALGGGGTPANLVGVGLLGWWVFEKITGGSRVDRRRQPIRIGLLALLLCLLASLIDLFLRPDSGKEALGAYRGLILIGCLVGLALVASDGIPSIERAMVLLRRMVLGISIVAALGLFEFFTKFNPARALPIPGLSRNAMSLTEIRTGFLRVQSTALHPIELGGVLGVMFPVAVHLAFHTEGDRRQRRRAWIQVAVIGAALPMTLSRTGIIAATIGCIALFWQWTWRRRIRALGVTILFVGAMRAVTPGLMGTVTGMFTYFFQDSSTTARTSRYGAAGDLFLQNPVFGRGYNTLFPATGKIFDNSYLYFAVETGIFGVLCVLFLFMVVFFVSRGIRLRTEDQSLRDLAGLLSATAITMPIMFVTADMMSFNMIMQLYFLLAGIAGALWRLTGGPDRAIVGRPRRHRAQSAPNIVLGQDASVTVAMEQSAGGGSFQRELVAAGDRASSV